MGRVAAAVVFGLATGLGLGGCSIGALIGGMAESYKKDSTHTVDAEYKGLAGKSFGVVVFADRSVDAQNPGVVALLTTRISERLHDQSGATGWVAPADMLAFLYNNPRWTSRSRIELAKELSVDRLVVVDLQEFRLNDAGNQYLWDGVAIGSVGVIETDSFAPDVYAFEKQVRVKFPDKQGTGPQEYSADLVTAALAKRFTDRTTWLFYSHEEPYYPEY